MKQLYEKFLNQVDGGKLYRRTLELAAIEIGQTTPCHIRAAEYVKRELEAAGIPGVERIDFPADGVTAYQDKVMPLAWDAAVGKLEFVDRLPGAWAPVNRRGLAAADESVPADFQRHPFHLVKGSTSTPPEGVVTRIITEAQLLSGADPRGAMVMLEPLTRPTGSVIRPMLDLGVLGFVTDFVVGRYESPDTLQWANAATESGNWHVTLEDRPFIGFTVTPRTGDLIRKHAGARVRVTCDGRRYAGVEPMITALVPGESTKEVWLFAHLYEPLLNDDSAGVSTAIEVAKMLLAGPKPHYSVRLVFAMELYGFAAYAALRGPQLKDEAVGGCNIDSICAVKGEPMTLYPTGNSKPFAGNALVRQAYAELKDVLDLELGDASYMDDLFLGDPTVGVPSVWLLGRGRGFWHNSAQCDPEFIDKDTMCRSAAFAAAFVKSLADTEPPAKTDVKVELKHTPWRDYAARMVLARKEPGFPYSQAKVPPYARTALPDGMLYGAFANTMCALDGRKSLAQAIAEAEIETGREKSESEVKKYIDAMNHLADYGYLTAVARPEITAEDIKKALRELGLTEKDLVLVHASVSNCGYIRGGAETLIRSVAESVDTALFTTFTRPYLYLGGPNRNWRYRPFDAADADAVWTGTVGKTVLRKFPDAVRSAHITHSWAGFGSRAKACLDAHGPCDPPAGETSPLAKALEFGGKILYFGAGLESTTFIHYLEDATRMPFLSTAFCCVKTPAGGLETVAVPRHLPGCREFYNRAMECKFFRRAFARGLELRRVKLGMGEIMLLDIRQLCDIGLAVIKDDAKVLLCDDPDCLFCGAYR
jgi:aminoglycoside N3'-acetyltransferase